MQYEDMMQHHDKDQTHSRSYRAVARLLAALTLLSLLVACKAEPSTTAEASISPYNHTEDYIHQLYIDGQWVETRARTAAAEASSAASPIHVNGTLA